VQRTPESTQRFDLALTALAYCNVGRRHPGRPGIQGPVEVGPEAPPCAETGQHIDWTEEEPPAILSPV